MYERVEKPKENKSRTVANSVAQKKSDRKQGFGFVDNRSECVAQRKVIKLSNINPNENQIAQLVKFKNTDTNKSYNVTEGSGRIDAVEIDGDGSGYITFDINKDNAILKHVESHPEVGSGLGAVLVHLFSLQVAAKSIDKVYVSAPATTALGFYAKLGFNIEEEQQKVREMYIAAGRKEDIPEIPAVAQAEANIQDIVAESSIYVHKRWTIV